MSRKINFKVVYVSGEDDKYKASELEYHGPSAQGWMSSKNCIFPQQIVLLLENAAIVQQMQILGHHCFIPERIDIWIGSAELQANADENGKKDQYKYVGFVSMSNNSDTEYKCRELKTIEIPYCAATRYVKLMLYRNHPNSLNVNNQVAIVAIQVMGKEAAQSESIVNSSNVDGLCSNDSMTSSAIIFDDLAFEMYVDKEIAHLLKLLHERKRSAVKDERFEYARKLKYTMEKLQLAGEMLGKLQIAKNQAIEREDYSRAKQKKIQIDEFKLQIYNSLNIDELLEKDGIISSNDQDDATLEKNLDVNSGTASNSLISDLKVYDSTLRNGEPKRSNHQLHSNEVMHPSPLQTLLVETHLKAPTVSDRRNKTSCDCLGSTSVICQSSPSRKLDFLKE